MLIFTFMMIFCRPGLSAELNSYCPPETLSIGCNFPTLEYYTCATEFPVIPAIFKDSISNNNEDQLYFEYIGGQINNPCNPVIITGSMVENMPTSCVDSFMVILEYLIDDGESVIPCRRTLITMRPPLRVLKDAQNKEVSCEENVDSLFSHWLANFGYAECFICYGTIRGTTTPNIPAIEYSCEGSGLARVTFNLRDGCNNKVNTTASFLVVDTIPPMIECPQNITFDISNPSLLIDIDTLINCATATDYCSQVIITHNFSESKILYNCDPIQSIPVEYTATDHCGNSASCQNYITLVNQAGPRIECPENITVECGTVHMDSLLDSWLMSASAFDFYEEATSILIQLDQNVYSNQSCDTTFLVVFSAEDICSRMAECSRTITVEDTSPPSIIHCPVSASFNYSDTALLSNVEDWISSLQGLDDCKLSALENDLEEGDLTFSCASPKLKIVSFQVTDHCGHTSSCTATLELLNDLDSKILCPPDITVSCGETDNLQKILDWQDSASGFDNFNTEYRIENNLNIELVTSYNCYVERQVRFSFYDICNNLNTCNSTVTVKDDLAPTISCPPNITIEADFDNIVQELTDWSNNFEAYDACRGVIKTNNFNYQELLECENSRTWPVIFTAKDSCSQLSSCTSMLTIVTDKAIEINCPPKLTVHCGESANEFIIENWLLGAKGTDFQDREIQAINDFDMNAMAALSCVDSIIVAFTATDKCLRSAVCQSSIMILDDQAPTISCPPQITVFSTEQNYESRINDWLNSAIGEDNCQAISIVNNFEIENFNPCHEAGVVEILFTARDQCQLTSTCNAYIHIIKEAPSIICPINLLLECGDASNEGKLDAWLLSAIGRDNINQSISVSNNYNSGTVIPECEYSFPVTFSVEDDCGMINHCTSEVVITDNIPPLINCPSTKEFMAGNPLLEEEIYSWLETATASDCNSFVIENDLDPATLEYGCDDNIIDVLFTAIDRCSHRSTCRSAIQIRDNVEAQISCPPPIAIECGDPNALEIVNDWLTDVAAEDNLGNSFIASNNFQSATLFSAYCNDEIIVEFESLDLCSHHVSCSSVIQIYDASLPTISCPESMHFSMQDAMLNSKIESLLTSVAVYDNCGIDNVNHNLVLSNHLPTCEDSITIPIDFVVIDYCGFSSSCRFEIRLLSESQPYIYCDPPIILNCGNSENPEIIQNWINGFSGFDYDGNPLEVNNDFSNSAFQQLGCDESLTINFSITDHCGDIGSCQSIIKLEDNIPPAISCPEEISVNNTDIEIANVLSQWILEYEASDNCTEIHITELPDFSDIDFCAVTQKEEYIIGVEDDCGNNNFCIAQVRILDAIPIIACPPRVEIECADDDNILIIENWLSQVIASDNSGNYIEFIHDYDDGLLINACEEMIEIQFTARDRCAQEVRCTSEILLLDRIAPEVICPISTSLNINDDQVSTKLEEWILQFEATDQCSALTRENDFDFDFTKVPCNEAVEVEFKAIDECYNESHCTSTIIFNNVHDVSIQCPEHIRLICESENIEIELLEFLQSYEIYSPLSYMVYHSPEIMDIDILCTESYEQVIVFEIEDECGNANQCATIIDFLPGAAVYIPNTFSPNGDGQNDYFTVFSNSSIAYIGALLIYDRWGNLVFEKHNFPTNIESEGWSGNNGNGGFVDGVYTYYTELSDIFSNKIIHSGTITLFK